jgi:cysteine synthase B
MAAAIRGYRMRLIMPASASSERKQAMRAYGAELIEVSARGGHGGGAGSGPAMRDAGEGVVLDQFANPDNPLAHYRGTGRKSGSRPRARSPIFVSSMGTTGTIMGCSAFLKTQNPDIEIVGLQPSEGASIPGIRRWPEAYLPKIFEPARVDRVLDITQEEAETAMRAMAREEGIFCGVSAGGAVAGALRIAREVENATIVAIICDRGDRYLSTGVFDGTERRRWSRFANRATSRRRQRRRRALAGAAAGCAERLSEADASAAATCAGPAARRRAPFPGVISMTGRGSPTASGPGSRRRRYSPSSRSA